MTGLRIFHLDPTHTIQHPDVVTSVFHERLELVEEFLPGDGPFLMRDLSVRLHISGATTLTTNIDLHAPTPCARHDGLLLLSVLTTLVLIPG